MNILRRLLGSIVSVPASTVNALGAQALAEVIEKTAVSYMCSTAQTEHVEHAEQQDYRLVPWKPKRRKRKHS